MFVPSWPRNLGLNLVLCFVMQLKYYLLELLLTSLRTETSSYNLRYLLHLLNVYVVEDVPFCPGLVGTVVKLIQEKVPA